MKRNLLQCMARVLLLPVALMFICGALVSAHAEYSGPKVRFRLAHPCPPGHHTSLAFEKFAELVAQKSKNKIKVHVFPNAVLGSDVVMLKGALTGGLEMAVSSSPNLTWVVPSLMVFDLPYITSVKYQKNLYEALDNGELGRYFKGKFNEVGLEPIMYCEYGYRDFFSVKKPIRSVGDLAGIQVRTTASAVEVEVAKALGNTFSFLLDAEHEDILKYAFASQHNYSMQILSANKKWWEELDPQVRSIIREAAAEALKYQREVLAPQSEEEAVKRFMADGLEVSKPSEAELEELKRKTRPVWNLFSDTLSQELIDLVVATQQ